MAIFKDVVASGLGVGEINKRIDGVTLRLTEVGMRAYLCVTNGKVSKRRPYIHSHYYY